MKTYEIVLFDLDGTLTDSGEGIVNTMKETLRHYGISMEGKVEMDRFIGPPLKETLMQYYGFSKEKATEAMVYFRERYPKRGIYENYVYEGIEELLSRLRRGGFRLAVATSKPEIFAKEVLRYFRLESYFEAVAGALMDDSRSKKYDVILHCLELLEVRDRSRVVMVGDRKHDVEGAARAGIDCIGVLYGYGTEEELTGAGAAHIAKKAEDIARILEVL